MSKMSQEQQRINPNQRPHSTEATMENMARLMLQMTEDNIKFKQREAESEERQAQQVMGLEEIGLKNDLQIEQERLKTQEMLERMHFQNEEDEKKRKNKNVKKKKKKKEKTKKKGQKRKEKKLKEWLQSRKGTTHKHISIE